MKNLSKLARGLLFTSFFFILFTILFIIWFSAKTAASTTGPGSGTVWVFMFVLVSPFILVASIVFGAISASVFPSETPDKPKKSSHKTRAQAKQDSAASAKYIPLVIGIIALPFLIQLVQAIYFQFILIPSSHRSLWSASQSQDPKACEKLVSDSLKIACLTDLAIETKNPSICINTTAKDLRGQCLAQLVISDKNSFECLQFKGQLNSYEFSNCTNIVATNTNDYKVCEALPTKEIYDCIKTACNNQRLQGQDSRACYQTMEKYFDAK